MDTINLPDTRNLEFPNASTVPVADALVRLPLLNHLTSVIAEHLAKAGQPRPACPVVSLDTELLRPLLGPQLDQVNACGHHTSGKSLVVFLPEAIAKHACALACCQPTIEVDSPLDLTAGEACFCFEPPRLDGEQRVELLMPIPALEADVWNIEGGQAWVPTLWVCQEQVALGGFFVAAGTMSEIEVKTEDAVVESYPPFVQGWEIEEALAALGNSSPKPWFQAPYQGHWRGGTLVVGTTEFTYSLS